MPLAEPTADHKPNVSAAIMADCDEAAYIAPNTKPDDAYRLWGQDRQALGTCRSLNAAKAATIKALQGGAQ